MGSKVFWSWKLLSIWGRFLAPVLISKRACILRDVSKDIWISQNLILLHPLVQDLRLIWPAWKRKESLPTTQDTEFKPSICQIPNIHAAQHQEWQTTEQACVWWDGQCFCKLFWVMPVERRHSALHPNLPRNLVTRCGSDVMLCICCVHAYLYVASHA